MGPQAKELAARLEGEIRDRDQRIEELESEARSLLGDGAGRVVRSVLAALRA